MSEPKTVQRRINFRKANRQMPRRRHDIPADQVVPTNPELLTKFTTETGKILPRRVTGVSAKQPALFLVCVQRTVDLDGTRHDL